MTNIVSLCRRDNRIKNFCNDAPKWFCPSVWLSRESQYEVTIGWRVEAGWKARVNEYPHLQGSMYVRDKGKYIVQCQALNLQGRDPTNHPRNGSTSSNLWYTVLANPPAKTNKSISPSMKHKLTQLDATVDPTLQEAQVHINHLDASPILETKV